MGGREEGREGRWYGRARKGEWQGGLQMGEGWKGEWKGREGEVRKVDGYKEWRM